MRVASHTQIKTIPIANFYIHHLSPKAIPGVPLKPLYEMCDIPYDYPPVIQRQIENSEVIMFFLDVSLEEVLTMMEESFNNPMMVLPQPIKTTQSTSKSTSNSEIDDPLVAFDNLVEYAYQSASPITLDINLKTPAHLIYTWVQTKNGAEYLHLNVSPVEFMTPRKEIMKDIQALNDMQTIYISKKHDSLTHKLTKMLSDNNFKPHYASYFKLTPENRYQFLRFAFRLEQEKLY